MSAGASIFNRSSKSQKRLFAAASLVAIVVSVVCLAYAFFVEPFRLVVDKQEARIDGWPSQFNGFKAVLISDIHGGSRGGDANSIQQIVQTANEQGADAVFLLGDYVSSSRAHVTPKMPMNEVADLLGNLRAKEGVYAVLGNHDGWLSDELVANELERVGIKVLDGKLATIERQGGRVRVLGLRDHLHAENWKSFSNEAKALVEDSDGTGPLILLEHSPDVLTMVSGDLAISSDTKIMFAGHTHGGQVWLPILGNPIVPSTYGQKYAAGHIRDRDVDVFVTTGTGTSILPFRFLVPPEVMVVTIRSS